MGTGKLVATKEVWLLTKQLSELCPEMVFIWVLKLLHIWLPNHGQCGFLVRSLYTMLQGK